MALLTPTKPQTPQQQKPEKPGKITPVKTLIVAISVAMCLLIGYPLARVLIGIVWVDGRISFGALSETLALPDLGEILFDTGVVIASAVALAMVIGSVLAWLNERTDARIGFVTDVLPIVNFIMPGIATAVGWVLLLATEAGYLNQILRTIINTVFGTDLQSGPFDVHSYYTVIGVYTLTLVPFVYLIVSAGLRNLDSRLEEQSRMSGAGIFVTLRRVTLPALRPSLLSGMFLAVWFGFANFSVPVVLAEPGGIKIISVQIVKMLTESYPPQTAVAIGLSSIILVALAIIWMLQQKAINSRRSATLGEKGAGAGRIKLGKLRIWARALMLLYLLGAIGMPLAALTVVTLNGFWGVPKWDQLSLQPFVDVFTTPANYDSITNSLTFALIVATIVMIIAACMSWAAVTMPSKVTRIAAAIIKIPAAIPSIVIAVGIVLAFAGQPLYLGGSALILIIGFLIVALPEGSVTSEAAVGQIGRELGHASSLSGAAPLRTFRSVYLPLMMPGVVAGWALIFVRIMADVEMSVLLASTQTPVIGFRLLGIFQGSGGYAELSAMALFVTLVSITVVGLALGIASAIQRRRNR